MTDSSTTAPAQERRMAWTSDGRGLAAASIRVYPPLVSPVQLQRRPSLLALVRLCRPQQWVKNVFVLAPLLFSGTLLSLGHLIPAVIAFGCYCLASSAVYVLNDMLDAGRDRQHPRKCQRPIASGAVSEAQAVVLLLALFAATALAAFALLPTGAVLLIGMYLLGSVLYCAWLKHCVLADVLWIATGFVLRLLGGCLAIQVEPSSWIVVCGFSLALVLGFGKRRTEVANLQEPDAYRPVLRSYNPAKLDTLLAISTAVCLLAYMLYTVSAETIERHQTRNLIYTVPLVAYGLFRYLLKTQEGDGDGPVEILVRDPVFSLTGVLWGGAVLLVLYFR